jgi:hypothetical protein
MKRTSKFFARIGAKGGRKTTWRKILANRKKAKLASYKRWGKPLTKDMLKVINGHS